MSGIDGKSGAGVKAKNHPCIFSKIELYPIGRSSLISSTSLLGQYKKERKKLEVWSEPSEHIPYLSSFCGSIVNTDPLKISLIAEREGKILENEDQSILPSTSTPSPSPSS